LKPAPVIAIAVVSGTIGFLLGRSAPAPERAARTAPRQDTIAETELRGRAAEPEERPVEEGRPVPARARDDLPAERAPEVPGTRREDGTIVGGARWTPQTRLLALGFLAGKVDDFFAQANLTEYQKQRLKAELEGRIDQVMQLAADYANGDIDGDQTYEALDKVVATGRAAVAQVLDERQLATYYEFEKGISDFNRTEIANNELATLRQELGLDREQERLVRPIVEERYRRVQERFGAPIPNMFFKPIRRARDRDLYEETGRAMREYLRPEQQAAFDVAEAKASAALTEYRSLLLPKG
jgi:hypothetical protein